ncbi:ribosomal protein S18-alanine N-acetyltransferase [Alloscardovia venturai]|uniref:Ribosomal protein S18-alanine N-acetyltransferase n=1 Tax=Alloscardovia venturai TaxID=1769421 RepID=A0ABW2Y3M6_9BIFI
MQSSYSEYFPERLDLPAVDDTDIDAIAELEQELFGQGAWSRAAVEQEFLAPDRTYFVVRNDERRIIAYAGFWFDGDDAEIMTIGVEESYQGRHIAVRLMKAMKEEARTCGAQRMLLEVAVNNAPALALYEKYGFTTIGVRKHYYQPENVDAYTMACTIDKENSRLLRNPVGFSIK